MAADAQRAVAPITAADGKDRERRPSFTWSGLEARTFQDARDLLGAVQEGIYQEDRLRRLGDKVEDRVAGTVIEGGPEWSGNIPVRKRLGSAGELSAGEAAAKERQVITPKTVHALLLLYDKDEDAVQTWARLVEDALAPHNVKVVHGCRSSSARRTAWPGTFRICRWPVATDSVWRPKRRRHRRRQHRPH